MLPDGPLRVITRVGIFTIYRHPTLSSSFDDPNSFRVGEPILVAGFRQQVVVDTVTQTFTTLNRETITAVKHSKAGAGTIQLGVVGGRFNTILNGHLNMPGPPSGYFVGYTIPAR